MDKKRAVILISLICLLAYSVYQKQKQVTEIGKSVIIIDQLYNENSAFRFVDKISELFNENGFKVITVRGENVTVDRLKKMNFERQYVIFRTHSGVFDNDVWIFTGERYSESKYVLDQIKGEVNIGNCPSY